LAHSEIAATPAQPYSAGGGCGLAMGCAATSESTVLSPAQPYSAGGRADRVGCI